MPRKIIAHIATSADGYIARPDGDFAWLERPPVKGNYGLEKFYQKIDTVIMGRATYEVGVKLGQVGYPGVQNYIFSSNLRPNPADHIQYTNEDIRTFAERLRHTAGKHIWLVGGAATIAAFLDCGQIDDFIMHVMPVFIGEGIPLIQPRHRAVDLKLMRTHRYSDGVVKLHYRVRR